MSTPLWKVYLTHAALPIGIVVSFLLVVRTLFSLLAPPPGEKAFDVECTLLGGLVWEMGNAEFCVKAERMQIALKSFKELCSEENGTLRREIIDGKYVDRCWDINVIEELGAKHEYTVNR